MSQNPAYQPSGQQVPKFTPQPSQPSFTPQVPAPTSLSSTLPRSQNPLQPPPPAPYVPPADPVISDVHATYNFSPVTAKVAVESAKQILDALEEKSEASERAEEDEEVTYRLDDLLGEDKLFESMFKGKYDVSSLGKGMSHSLAFIESIESLPDRYRVLKACLVFSSKPLRFLTKGEVIDKRDGGRTIVKVDEPVDPTLAQYLPKLSEEELRDRLPSSEGRVDSFRSINMTSTRRIGLTAVVLFPEMPLSKEWIRKHHGNPLNCQLPTSEEVEKDETKRIFKEMILKYREEFKADPAVGWKVALGLVKS